MDLNAARQAQAILPQLDAITELHDSIVVAETQAWRLVEMTVEAPDGRRLRLLPFGTATPEMSALALSQAKTFYEAKLAELGAALAAL